MMRWSVALVALIACLVVASGCRKGIDRDRYDNRRALGSTVRQPVSGSEDDRTYRNSRYAEGSLGWIRLRTAEIDAPPEDDPAYEDFLRSLSAEIDSAAAAALRESERFSAVLSADGAPPPAGPGAVGFVCSVEVLVHVPVDMQTVRVDPVFRDSRPKLIVVYTVQRDTDGEVAFKYTSVVLSHWEYGPWAMEDLRVKAVESAAAFRDAIREE